MQKKTSFNRPQILVLVGLVIVIIAIFSFAVVYVFAQANLSAVNAPSIELSPTTYVVPSPTDLPNTATLIPTFVYNPTFTPIPSPTSFLLNSCATPDLHTSTVPKQPAPTKSSGSKIILQLFRGVGLCRGHAPVQLGFYRLHSPTHD